MPLETDDLVQDGVLWPVQGADGFGAQRVGSPVPFKARWQLGDLAVSSAVSNVHRVVGTAAVDRLMKVESIVFKGTMAEYLATQPLLIELMQVVSIKTTPDVKGHNNRYHVVLGPWNGNLPPAIL